MGERTANHPKIEQNLYQLQRDYFIAHLYESKCISFRMVPVGIHFFIDTWKKIPPPDIKSGKGSPGAAALPAV
jgi:hypothetical protein